MQVSFVMIVYIPHTFHSEPAYYVRSMTPVQECFIDAYCMYNKLEGVGEGGGRVANPPPQI